MFCIKKSVSYTMLVLLTVDLLATSGDITMTWTSPMYPKLYSNDSSINPLAKPITEDQDGWIGSLINIGAIIGPLPFGFISEKFGRKVGLLCVAIPHIASYLTMAFADKVYLFYFGRILGGIAVGGGYTLLPMYIAEVAEDSTRGVYSVFLGVFWGFGNFLPYAIGPFLSAMWFNVAIAFFPITFFIIFLFIGTETPYYLVGTKKIDQAEEILMLLRSSDKQGIKSELKHIQDTLKKEEHGHLMDIFSNAGLRKALIISVSLIMFQQLSGINAITFYLQPIFEASGTKLSSDISSLIVGACLFIFSFLPPLIVNRFGRRTLLITSSAGMTFTLVSMGVFFYINDNTKISPNSIDWLPTTSLVLMIFTFQLGYSVIPWTVSSELFPSNVKQISASATSTSCWIWSFVITKFFNDMNNGFGRAGTFWFFSGFSLTCSIFVAFYVPETRGKTFSEIQDILQK